MAASGRPAEYRKTTMRVVILLAAAATATAPTWQWRERLGLDGSACPVECPLRARSILNIKDFGRAGFADRQFIIEGVAIMAVSLCARVVLPLPEQSFGGHDMRVGREMQWKHFFELRDAAGAPVLESKNIIGAVEGLRNTTSFESQASSRNRPGRPNGRGAMPPLIMRLINYVF